MGICFLLSSSSSMFFCFFFFLVVCCCGFVRGKSHSHLKLLKFRLETINLRMIFATFVKFLIQFSILTEKLFLRIQSNFTVKVSGSLVLGPEQSPIFFRIYVFFCDFLKLRDCFAIVGQCTWVIFLLMAECFHFFFVVFGKWILVTNFGDLRYFFVGTLCVPFVCNALLHGSLHVLKQVICQLWSTFCRFKSTLALVCSNRILAIYIVWNLTYLYLVCTRGSGGGLAQPEPNG